MRQKRMAEAMVSDSSRDFWHEVNCCKIRKQTPAICVDGVLGDDKIVELWADPHAINTCLRSFLC